MLSFVPHPVLSLIPIMSSKVGNLQKGKSGEESTEYNYEGSGEAEGCIWFKQTMNNACGFYDILHWTH